MNSFFDSIDTKIKVPSRASLTKAATNLINRRPTRRGKKKKGKTAKWNKEFQQAMTEHKRVKAIPSMTYRLYMGSAYWIKRKRDYFSKHGKTCAVCGITHGVTLHHKIYDNKLNGREPDNHFVALCPGHHHEFHLNHKLAQNMSEDTDMYVTTMKQVIASNIDDLSWI